MMADSSKTEFYVLTIRLHNNSKLFSDRPISLRGTSLFLIIFATSISLDAPSCFDSNIARK